MFAVIRIRGLKHVRVDIRDTLRALSLDRKNHCVLVKAPQRAELEGMLVKAKDYVAYGSIQASTLGLLLQKRGRLSGNKRVTVPQLEQHHFESFEAAAQALLDAQTTLPKLGIKTVFRLNAPRKGFSRGIKKSTELKGDLGYHANGLDELLKKMM